MEVDAARAAWPIGTEAEALPLDVLEALVGSMLLNSNALRLVV